MSNQAKFNNMELKGSVSGEYLLSVIKTDGTEVFPLGKEFRKNLVLNSGLDMLFNTGQAGNGFASVMTACRAGGGNTTANVADVVLAIPFSASNTYTGACGTNVDTANSSSIHKRTFDFAAEVGTSKNYNELGFSNDTNQATNLFSRVVLPSTVTVLVGEKLRVVYQLKCTLVQTTTAATVTLNNGGFTGDGSIKCVGIYSQIFGTVNPNGSESAGVASYFLGRSAGNAWLLTNSTYPSINTDLSPSYTGVSQADSQSATASGTYVGGTFYKDLTYVWSASIPASTETDARAVMFGGSVARGSLWIFNANQTKENTKTLTLVLRVAWTR
jgi:hypothetical protein